jgi:hypothetical protein
MIIVYFVLDLIEFHLPVTVKKDSLKIFPEKLKTVFLQVLSRKLTLVKMVKLKPFLMLLKSLLE